MRNESKIKGDRNFVLQGNRNSKIDRTSKNENLPIERNYSLFGIVITLLGLIATIIIGWDNIIKFFTK
jgi:hypothetical protein